MYIPPWLWFRSNSLDREIGSVKVKNLKMKASNQVLTIDLQQVNAENEVIRTANREQAQTIQRYDDDSKRLESENEHLGNRLDILQRVNERLDSDLDELQAENYQLVVRLDRAGSIEELEVMITSLRAEITDLKRERSPLLLESGISTFRCTGSMEPKLTCLDSATMLNNFFPEDITVGAIISF